MEKWKSFLNDIKVDAYGKYNGTGVCKEPTLRKWYNKAKEKTSGPVSDTLGKMVPKDDEFSFIPRTQSGGLSKVFL